MTRKAKTEEQKKFEFTGETKVEFGVTFQRIRALITIAGVVSAGDLGGWLQHENNLSQVSDKAWVFGEAQVFDKVRVSPIFISGLPWSVTISDRQMVIGCQHHTIAEWDTFDDRSIAAMDGTSASRFWRDFKEPLFALIKATGRPFAQVNTADEASEPAQSEAAE